MRVGPRCGKLSSHSGELGGTKVAHKKNDKEVCDENQKLEVNKLAFVDLIGCKCEL
jgi:hypothetical protein